MSASKIISNLCISEPLYLEDSYSTDFVDVSQYKQIRVSIESDSMLSLYFEWSMNGDDANIIDKWSCNANTWKSDLVSVVLPLLRIRLYKEIPSANNRINVYVNPVSLNKAISTQPVVLVENDEKQAQDKRKSKSPFFRRGSEKKEVPKSSVPQVDFRLPAYLPSGTILIGGRNGQIEFLPRGLPGEVLIMGEKGPMWVDMNIYKS